MIRIENLCKKYVTKGETVVALNNVNLVLPDSGMVFVLGKSGSGKSTFLNVVGGLDKYDSGNVIINGRSSSNFSDAEFDAYRNTFVGFIFQEYNVLEEFTVGENVMLALELRGEKDDAGRLEKVLEDVELGGLKDNPLLYRADKNKE